MKVVALAGGTGSAKLLRGLATLTSQLTVVANVGDNFWFHGLYVCPDVDIACYTLAGVADAKKGWGVEGDTFKALGQLGDLGEETWFRLGDMDLAASMVRTGLLRAGRSLTEVTLRLAKALEVPYPILPATDSAVETWMRTESGAMHLQEFWVRERGRPRVTEVEYRGARRASPTRQVERALAQADKVVLCPANPITSIGPIVAVNGMRKLLSRSKAEVVALSPMIGARPYSGPAGRLMRQLGLRPDSAGVASLYSGFIDRLVIDRSDLALSEKVAESGVECSAADTRMRSRSDERRVARVLLEA
ncbi:MAG: 2-phospho-L-lactate transferase [Nitrososphaerota archaeon]|nr:2-phospho-L-lactate transferase [Nitrososphaerota archaeon]